MRNEKQIESFVKLLRTANKEASAGQQNERAIARDTLWVMGMILIQPVVRRLAETGELHLIYPVAKLYFALGQLDDGVVDPILMPANKFGRPTGSGVSYKVRGAAAAAMTVLIEQGGQSAEAAGRAVARMLDKKGIKQPSGKPIDGGTVVHGGRRYSRR